MKDMKEMHEGKSLFLIRVLNDHWYNVAMS